MLTGAPTVQAQATPAAAPLDVPPPRDCEVAPREEPLFPAGVGQRAAATPAPVATPSARPFAPPAGEPADAETAAAVRDTVREAIACRNAGDFLRAYALFTQDMIVQLLGGPATIDIDIGVALEVGPQPVPRQERLALVFVDDVTVLPDGRVGAVVETRNARWIFRDFLFFERDPESGRWLIDERHPVPVR